MPRGRRPWSENEQGRDLSTSLSYPDSTVQEHLKRDPHGGDLYVFRGRGGGLVKIVWHDGIGLSLYAKRLERGRFIWPATEGGAVSLTMGQLGYLLEGIDWRNPQHSWRPTSAG